MGVILTMTLVMMTAMAMTRERERGTLENLLATPVRPLEMMVGKILPYVLIGYLQVLLVFAAARLLFGVPMHGSFVLLTAMVLLFITATLTVGFTFSTIARSQMQSMQMTMFYFLPNILLSGFMFPFRGMPRWAQMLGELLPLTHFLRIVRAIMLKGATWPDMLAEAAAIAAFIAWWAASPCCATARPSIDSLCHAALVHARRAGRLQHPAGRTAGAFGTRLPCRWPRCRRRRCAASAAVKATPPPTAATPVGADAAARHAAAFRHCHQGRAQDRGAADGLAEGRQAVDRAVAGPARRIGISNRSVESLESPTQSL
jgi:ABC-type polysaccharide/polyol phosphate export permease